MAQRLARQSRDSNSPAGREGAVQVIFACLSAPRGQR
jgi:hypothetical protein